MHAPYARGIAQEGKTMSTMTELTVPTHATHVVADRDGNVLAWATSGAVAMAVAEQHGPGAYIYTHVSWDIAKAERAEALAELAALNEMAALEDAAEAFERVLTEAGLAEERVTHAVALEAPAKFPIGFTAGGSLAKRSAWAMRKAGIKVPEVISPTTVAEAVREAGYAPEIVPASTL